MLKKIICYKLLFLLLIVNLIIFTLSCSVRYYSKEAHINLNQFKIIHLGWIDMHEENWALYFYNSKDEWKSVINKLNAGFQVRVKNEFLTDKTINMSTYDNREPSEKDGLYIKFSNVKVDQNSYYLIMDIAFIDLNSNTKLYEISQYYFYGNSYGLENILYYALEETGKLLHREFYWKKY